MSTRLLHSGKQLLGASRRAAQHNRTLTSSHPAPIAARLCGRSAASSLSIPAQAFPRASTIVAAAMCEPAAAVVAFPPAVPEGLEQIGINKQFGGFNLRYRHSSSVLGCHMTFTVYLPPAAATSPVPVLYWLSGLTCTDENFITKSGAQRAAAAHGVALVAPDTSPRGLGIEGESDSWDFGVGAGFYINATEPKWANWRMYDYVKEELPSVLRAAFPTYLDATVASLSGHSMGGHGALVVGLTSSPGAYRSISAFAPICHPSVVPWGIKAFSGYLGEDNKEAWAQYDAVEVLKARGGEGGRGAGDLPPLLVDTGSADSFLVGGVNQLRPEDLEEAALAAGYGHATLRLQEGYDHSYFFISTFIDEHIAFHAKHLKP